jgi:hypothetical protein
MEEPGRSFGQFYVSAVSSKVGLQPCCPYCPCAMPYVVLMSEITVSMHDNNGLYYKVE